MNKTLFILMFVYFSILLSGQSTEALPLIKLSKTLESKNISSRIVTYNVKSSKAVKKKKIKQKKSLNTKPQQVTLPTQPVPNTFNIKPIAPPSKRIVQKKLKTPPQPSTLKTTPPIFYMGTAANHLPLPKSRINPSSTISSWLSGYLKISFLEVSAGYSRFSENDVSGSLAFTASNTESYFGQILLTHSVNSKLDMFIGYLIIKSDGILAYGELNNATIEGIQIGLQQSLTEDIELNIGWFPKLNNTYELDNIDVNQLPERFHPSNSFNTTISYGVFMFSLKYNFFSF